MSAPKAILPARSAEASGGRNANAATISSAARPVLNRKNFTPASRETKTSVKAMPIAKCARKRNRTSLLQPLVDLRPVDDIPPRVDVVGPAILILEVVRVLPDVDAEDGLLAVHHRVVLVRRALDDELAAVVDHPRPPAAEPSDRGRLQLLLQLVEAAERAVDRVGNRARRRAAGVRPHDLPEHRVVQMAAAVVAHGGTNRFGHAVDALDEVLEALRRKLRGLFNGSVEVRHVRVVVLAVMNLHRLLVDVRFERVARVRKWRKCVSHRASNEMAGLTACTT